ncbi:MAG: HAMP domain-containing protein [Nitrospirae bacterium]|nr:HAMP domain-containing protein [Nitrospirota bacterium]MBI3352992.1 HAMP domain-containing protein [Nitrospirota bacterium]
MKIASSESHKKSSNHRFFLRPLWLFILLVLLMISMGTIYVKGIRASPFSSNILVLTIMNLNIILVILTLILLSRNLVKLYFERNVPNLGTSFRTRLIFAFVGISLIPSIILFFIAAVLLSTSIENWFSLQAERAINDSLEVGRSFYQQEGDLSFRRAKEISQELSKIDIKSLTPAELGDFLNQKRTSLDVEGIDLYFSNPKIKPIHSSNALQSVGHLTDDVLARVVSGKERYTIIETGAGNLVVSRVNFSSTFEKEVRGIVLVRMLIPQSMVNKIEDIAEASEEYRQFKTFKNPIKGSYILSFLIITLVIMFSATWFGFYLARGITVPLLKLAEGTQAVAQGNLDFKIDIQAKDEIGVLVHSFNTMTSDLKLNKNQLEEANTSLKTSNLEIEQRRAYIEAILENIGTGVISINQEGLVKTFNQSAEKILNLKASEVIGKPYREGFKPLHLNDLVKSFEKKMEKKKMNLEEEIQIKIHQKLMTLKVILTSLYNNQGDFLGVVIVFDDLSDLLKAQKVAAWQEVARRLAHEIKNPLTPIQLASQRLRKKFYERASDFETVFDESTKIIMDEVNSMKTMVDEFSQFARMPVSHPVSIQPHRLIQDIIFLYQNAHKDVLFHTSWDPSMPLIHADPEQIKRVFINLFENSIEAMSSSGKIWVKTIFQPEQKKARFEISDDGVGIQPEDMDKLFLPYFSKRKSGTGLGLAIVHRIISDHQGTIRIENNVPRGTKVIIEMPTTA